MPVSPLLSSRDIAEIAHELRAPLGGFDAILELLGQTPLTQEQTRLMAALRASALHMRSIADRALLQSEAQRADHQDADTSTDTRTSGDIITSMSGHVSSLGAFLGTFGVSAQARAAQAGLGFTLDVEDDALRFCEVETTGLRQVLENLVDNAIRLTSDGAVSLVVMRRGTDRLSFELCDDGPGLSVEQASRLIEHGGAIEGRAGGAGLGLSICGRVVTAAGGQISGGPRSAYGGGRFIFDWPILREAEPASTDKTCLIVDDHPASRLVLKTILAAFGVVCDEASTVAAARDLVAQRAQMARKYQVVFTDLRMPDGDGEILIRELAAMPEPVRAQIVVVSADALSEASACAHHLSGAILKPLSVQAVADLVMRLGLGRTQAHAA